MALPRRNRLRHRRDFKAVYRQGRRFNTPHLRLHCLPPCRLVPHRPTSLKKTTFGTPVAPNPETPKEHPDFPDRPPQGARDPGYPPAQVGIVVSQKVSKRAVVRNRIRRQLQAIVPQLLPQAARGWRFVITVKPEAIECSYDQFLQELEQLIKAAMSGFRG